MNKKEHAIASMKILGELIGKFYAIHYDEVKNTITIPFVGYTIVIKVKFHKNADL